MGMETLGTRGNTRTRGHKSDNYSPFPKGASRARATSNGKGGGRSGGSVKGHRDRRLSGQRPFWDPRAGSSGGHAGSLSCDMRRDCRLTNRLMYEIAAVLSIRTRAPEAACPLHVEPEPVLEAFVVTTTCRENCSKGTRPVGTGNDRNQEDTDRTVS